MTTAQLRQLLAAARKDPAFEAYIQRKRAQVQTQIERKRDMKIEIPGLVTITFHDSEEMDEERQRQEQLSQMPKSEMEIAYERLLQQLREERNQEK